ncbi:GCN5 family acetyltransferase [Candidatus Magnetomorum sp. HK-1]|nr:GCN5 family acetyltransferase [Candidatus Magnetomorum sp. HK-1]
MRCLDRQESFQVHKIELSDEFFIECAANIYEQALGSYNPKNVLFQKIHDQHAFLLCAVGKHQEPLGAIIGWILKKKHEMPRYKHHLVSFEFPVGYIKSLAVIEAWRGKGIGSTLVNNILHCFCLYGCHHAFCEAWDKSLVFWGKEGFAQQSQISNYWYDESSHTPNFCIKCGSPCTCDAIIMVKTLYPNTYKNVDLPERIDRV